MTGIGIDTDEYGSVAGLRLLQSGGKLEGMGRYHAVVVVGSGDECGRIADALPDVVERRIALEILEHLLGVLACTIVGAQFQPMVNLW